MDFSMETLADSGKGVMALSHKVTKKTGDDLTNDELIVGRI